MYDYINNKKKTNRSYLLRELSELTILVVILPPPIARNICNITNDNLLCKMIIFLCFTTVKKYVYKKYFFLTFIIKINYIRDTTWVIP